MRLIRHLFIPGLLGPMPGAEQAEQQPLPLLETLLARADRLVEPVGYSEGLFALFGIDIPPGIDLPTAAICFLADTGEAPGDSLLHADPLHLIPDRDHVLAFDLDDDPLDSDEIAQLVEAFNGHFEDEGIRLLDTPSGGLYLHCDRAPAIRTDPLSTLIGRNLDLFLPEGADRRRWRGLLNETQMLCHSLALNHEREATGRATLGGLWFSGSGGLPPRGRGPVARLVGEGLLPRGLLALRPGGGADELIVEHAPGRAVMRADAVAWLQALNKVEARMADLLRDCEELHLHTGDGTIYRWHARSARRFWRRKRPLSQCLDTNPGVPHGGKGV